MPPPPERPTVDAAGLLAAPPEVLAAALTADPTLASSVDSYGAPLLWHAILAGNHHALRELLRHGAKPNELNDEGDWPLKIAAQCGDLEALAILLQAGAHPDHPVYARKHLTPAGQGALALDSTLGVAAAFGNHRIVQALIAAQANPNFPDVDDWTPLHAAAFSGHADVAKMLLDAGANPKLKDRSDRTPGELSWEQGHAELAKLLGGKPPQPADSARRPKRP